jgi:hypothetical protein
MFVTAAAAPSVAGYIQCGGVFQLNGGSFEMARFLIQVGLAIALIGFLWPYLSRLGLGRLPGDIIIRRDNVTFYFPIVTCLLVSAAFSLVLWVLNR